LLKEAFVKSSPEFKSKLYENRYKPFTFSLYLPRVKADTPERGSIRLLGEPLLLIFSSSCFEHIMHFINGVQKIEDFDLSIPVKIGRPYILPKVEINLTKKTYYVNDALFYQYDDNGKVMGYAKCSEPEFDVAVMRHIFARVKRALPELGDDILSEITVRWEWCKTFNLIHYGGPVSAVRGVFSLTAPKEVQQLLYDEGFGARTAQGFGMLEHGEHRLRG
jgi:CRISPR-associated endoribonuclease Cas6